MKRVQQGFTLIELMIVVAIIAIIAAIAIPNLLRSRLQSNEAAAIGNLRTVVGSQSAFASAERGYASSWAELRDDPIAAGQPAYLDIDLSGLVQGYDYAVAGDGNTLVGSSVASVFTNFTATAVPNQIGRTGIRGFFVDASGVIRFDPAGGAPDETFDPI